MSVQAKQLAGLQPENRECNRLALVGFRDGWEGGLQANSLTVPTVSKVNKGYFYPMKTIQLTQNKVATVDDEDYQILSKYKWSAYRDKNTWYAKAWIGGKNQKMHRFILDAQNKTIIDHINRDGLDNRKSNLRFCNKSQNMANSHLYKNNKLGYRGVDFMHGKFRATIFQDGRKIHIGYFDTPEEAHDAYLEKAKLLFGEFSR